MTDHSAHKRKLALTAVATGLALTIGAEASAFASSTTETLGSAAQLRAKILGNPSGTLQEDKGGEGRCGEGKCGGTKKEAASPTSSPAPSPHKSADDKSGEGKCGEGKCGGSK